MVTPRAAMRASMAVPAWPPDQHFQRAMPRLSVYMVTEGRVSSWPGSMHRQRAERPIRKAGDGDSSSSRAARSTRRNSSSRSIIPAPRYPLVPNVSA